MALELTRNILFIFLIAFRLPHTGQTAPYGLPLYRPTDFMLGLTTADVGEYTNTSTTEVTTNTGIATRAVISTAETEAAFVPFNSSWCASVKNLKDVPTKEARFENLKERICFGRNDTARKILLSQLDTIIEKRHGIDVIFDKIVASLSEGDEERKAILVSPENVLPEKSWSSAHLQCYMEVMYLFQDMCAALPDNPYLLDMTRILSHACKADWLQVETIERAIRSACPSEAILVEGAE